MFKLNRLRRGLINQFIGWDIPAVQVFDFKLFGSYSLIEIIVESFEVEGSPGRRFVVFTLYRIQSREVRKFRLQRCPE